MNMDLIIKVGDLVETKDRLGNTDIGRIEAILLKSSQKSVCGKSVNLDVYMRAYGEESLYIDIASTVTNGRKYYRYPYQVIRVIEE